MPRADTHAMQAHLKEISRTVGTGNHAVVLPDRAGWLTAAALNACDNTTLLFLPPRSPELNPTENIWQRLRQTCVSNRVFETDNDILDAVCQTVRAQSGFSCFRTAPATASNPDVPDAEHAVATHRVTWIGMVHCATCTPDLRN